MDERIVRVDDCWAVFDAHLGYWRGTSRLHEYDAWTRDTTRRALFSCWSDARLELVSILAYRRRASP